MVEKGKKLEDFNFECFTIFGAGVNALFVVVLQEEIEQVFLMGDTNAEVVVIIFWGVIVSMFGVEEENWILL